MAQLLEYIKMALDNIRTNKGRSLLTMLGIIIGIASVIMIISIGNGAKNKVNDELNGLAGGQIVIYTNSEDGKGLNDMTLEDIQAIGEKVDHVKGVSPQSSFSGSVLTGKGSFDASVALGTEDSQYFSKQTMKRGSYYTESDFLGAKKVCVINSTDAITMFGTDDVIGMPIELTLYGITQEFTIVGVQNVSESSILSSMYSTGAVTVNVPYTAIEAGYGFNVSPFPYMYIVVEAPEYSKEVASAAINLMEARHNCRGQDVFLMQDFNDQMDQIMNVLNIFTYFIVLVAAISLLVGGIGVMNIMLVSVTERTREIGIRKSLGARTGSIMTQFLSESAIITLMGGIIGIIIGVLGAIGVCTAIGISASISIVTILMATLFSSAVGIFFGIYPARKAAKMSPIDALRYN